MYIVLTENSPIQYTHIQTHSESNSKLRVCTHGHWVYVNHAAHTHTHNTALELSKVESEIEREREREMVDEWIQVSLFLGRTPYSRQASVNTAAWSKYLILNHSHVTVM